MLAVSPCIRWIEAGTLQILAGEPYRIRRRRRSAHCGDDRLNSVWPVAGPVAPRRQGKSRRPAEALAVGHTDLQD